MQHQLSEKEKQIRELESQTTAADYLFKNLPGGYHRCAIDEGYSFLYVSQRFLNLLGWTEEELHTKFDNKFLNLVHPEDREIAFKYVKRILSSNPENPYQDAMYRLQCKDGYHWFSDTTMKATVSGQSFFQGIIADISAVIAEREKELKDLLKSSEQRYQIIAALGTAYEEICQINLIEQIYMVVAGAFEGQRGNLDELKTFFIEKNISEKQREEAEAIMDFSATAERLKEQKMVSQEFKSRSGRWFLISFVAKKRNENGDVTHMLMTARNVSEQKHRELEQQRITELRLKTITEAIHGGFKIGRPDAAGTFIKVSEQLAHMLGYDSPDEMMEMSDGCMVGIVDRENFGDEMQKAQEAVAADRMYTMNYRIRCKDGSWKNIEERGRLICNEYGEKELWSFVSDQDELVKKTEALDAAHHANVALEKAQSWTEDYNKSLLDMVKCGVLAYTVPGYRLLHMNAEALRIYGVQDISEAQEKIGGILRKAVYLDPAVPGRLKKLREGDGAVDYECIITNPFGKQTRLLAQTEEFSSLQGERRVVTTFLDISENQTLKNALAASNKKNQIIGAISGLYWQVFSVDLKKDIYKEVFTDGKFTMDDPSYLGLAQLDFLKVVHDFVTSDYKEQMESFLDHSTLPQRLQRTDTISMEFMAKSGLWFSARYIVQMRDEDGNVIKVLFLVQQIDEQKRKELDYQKKLKETAEKAKLANEAKTNFLRRMSHDIRTPLNGILGLLKIDEAHFDDPALLRENHRKMDSSAKHLLSLINDVLQTSKLEDGKVILSHEIVDLTELSRNIVNIISVRAAEAGIKWEYHTISSKPPHPYIYGSPVHLRQIFLNIYGNCIKYNRPNGKINTVVEILDQGEKTGRYRWTISDTGIGMSREFLAHIFEPFAQEDSRMHGSYQGVGLGMSIVKGLVDQMGGTIRVSSEEGVGSVFEITLPFELAPSIAAVDEQAFEENCDIHGIHLLLAEDNELNAEIAQILLGEEGAQITRVSNGQEVVETFDENPENTFDAILMDVMMPVMDGLKATRTIRALKRPDAKTIPIIAMTANAFREDERSCLEAGMNAHLAKPLEIEKVKQTICSQLRKKS